MYHLHVISHLFYVILLNYLICIYRIEFFSPRCPDHDIILCLFSLLKDLLSHIKLFDYHVIILCRCVLDVTE